MAEYKWHQGGFTLIEVMVALLVFTIGMLAVAQLMGVAIRGDSRASLLTQAELLAEQQMEQLMVLAYDDDNLDDFNGDGIAGLNNLTAATADRSVLGAGNGAFNIFWNVAEASPMDNTKTIRVTVVPVLVPAMGQYQLNFIKLAGDVAPEK